MPSMSIFCSLGTRPWIKVPGRFNLSSELTFLPTSAHSYPQNCTKGSSLILWQLFQAASSGMGIPWRGCSCSSEGTRSVFQAFQGAVVLYVADRWSVHDGKIVLIVLPRLKLWWSRNLCSGNADVELRKHSWRQRGGEGRPGACTHEGWRLKQREITPGQNSVEK